MCGAGRDTLPIGFDSPDDVEATQVGGFAPAALRSVPEARLSPVRKAEATSLALGEDSRGCRSRRSAVGRQEDGPMGANG